MRLSTIGTRGVVTVAPTVPVSEIACMMNDRVLGSVVVVQDDKPIGIITDRDLVVRVLCQGTDARSVMAEAVMSSPLTTITDDAESLQAATLMREAQVRRLPIVDELGRLKGIVTLDDLFFHMSRTQSEMAQTIAAFPVPHYGG
jgi:CBS domain-containing protein